MKGKYEKTGSFRFTFECTADEAAAIETVLNCAEGDDKAVDGLCDVLQSARLEVAVESEWRL